MLGQQVPATSSSARPHPDGPRAPDSSRPLREFLRTEEGSGLLLFLAAVLAFAWANSPLGESYRQLWDSVFGVRVGGWEIAKDVRHWVNDGLMALFFLVVGLEIKRELTTGELREPRKLALPALAALGGMVVPAALYLPLNAGEETSGWGVTVATDIAFALWVLTLVVSMVGLFVDPTRPQRRHPVLFPVPVVASRWSRRRAG